MIVLPNMGLVKWDSINDTFSHEQLANNFQALDEHDHTPGKGKPIPYGALAEQSVGAENLRENVTLRSVWRNITSTWFIATEMTSGNTYFVLANGLGLPKAGSEAPPVGIPNGYIYLRSADFVVSGLTPKLQLFTTLATNGTAPGFVQVSFALYPVTAMSSVAGATTIKATFGAPVSGSSSTYSFPAANSQYNSSTTTGVVTTASSEFSLPADGYYAPAVSISGTQATNSIIASSMVLRVHHV